jgi:hypothetical protein
VGSNSKIQNVWLTWERIMLTFGLFFLFFLFFHCLFYFLFFFFLLLLHTMDEHKHKILVAFVFTMAMHRMIAQVIALQWVAIGQHWSMMNGMLFFMEFVDMASRIHNMWRYERAMGYMKIWLFGSFFEKMFRQWTRLS